VPPDTPLQKIMNPEVISVTIDTDQEEMARQVTRYNLLAIPVVDKGNKLAGIITFDDVIDVVREEATEDILRVRQFSDLVLSPVRWDSKMLFVEWENMKRLVCPSFSLELDKV